MEFIDDGYSRSRRGGKSNSEKNIQLGDAKNTATEGDVQLSIRDDFYTQLDIIKVSSAQGRGHIESLF